MAFKRFLAAATTRFLSRFILACWLVRMPCPRLSFNSSSLRGSFESIMRRRTLFFLERTDKRKSDFTNGALPWTLRNASQALLISAVNTPEILLYG